MNQTEIELQAIHNELTLLTREYAYLTDIIELMIIIVAVFILASSINQFIGRKEK